MFSGVIYKYTSPSNRSYIGQTARESQRRSLFLNIKHPYTCWGSAIDNARLKYGPFSFKYEIVCTVSASSEESLSRLLDMCECWYIQKFDSFRSGYNSNLGGGSNLGCKLSEAVKRKLRGRVVLESTRLQFAHPVCCWDLSFNFVGEYLGIIWACRALGISSNNVCSVCKSGGGVANGYLFCYLEDRDVFSSTFSTRQVRTWSTSKRLIAWCFISSGANGVGYACDLSRSFNIPVSHIVRVCRGKRKSAGGYVFRYVD